MRVFAVAILAILLLVPLAQAGSVSDPEVTDPAGDGGPAGKDILKVWIEDELVLNGAGLESLIFAFEIASDGPDLSSLYALHERVRIGFKPMYDGAPAGTELYVFGEPNVGTTTQTGESRFLCRFGIAATQGGSQDTAAEQTLEVGDWDGKTFRCLLPLDLIGGAAARGGTLADIWAKYELVQRGPNAGGDAAGVNTHVLDRAPNAGFGRDYMVSPPIPEAPSIVYSNITAFPFSSETTDPTTGVFQYNWTGDAAFRFVGEVLAGNMTINVTANGAQVFAWNGTDGLDASMEAAFACADESAAPAPCAYAFIYTLTDFVGSYGIDHAPEKPVTEGNVTGETPGQPGGPTGGEPAAGNETAEPVLGDDAGKESPGFALPLLLLALIVIARRR